MRSKKLSPIRIHFLIYNLPHIFDNVHGPIEIDSNIKFQRPKLWIIRIDEFA